MIPKKRPVITEAQKRLFDAHIKRDVFDFLGAFMEPAARKAGEFLDQNPNNVVTQVLSNPFMKATLVSLKDGVGRMRAEADAEAATAGSDEQVSESSEKKNS